MLTYLDSVAQVVLYGVMLETSRFLLLVITLVFDPNQLVEANFKSNFDANFAQFDLESVFISLKYHTLFSFQYVIPKLLTYLLRYLTKENINKPPINFFEDPIGAGKEQTFHIALTFIWNQFYYSVVLVFSLLQFALPAISLCFYIVTVYQILTAPSVSEGNKSEGKTKS